MKPSVTSCGVIVAAGDRILLGQATGSPGWDIPKGVAEDGEDWLEAAARELREETGLHTAPASLRPLGRFDYLPRKDLALFTWRPVPAPDPAVLRCTSMARTNDGRLIPELSRFALLPWHEALARVGKNMARVLNQIGPERVLGSDG